MRITLLTELVSVVVALWSPRPAALATFAPTMAHALRPIRRSATASAIAGVPGSARRWGRPSLGARRLLASTCAAG